MMQRQFIDLDSNSDSSPSITHFSEEGALPWSGVVHMKKHDRFALARTWRQDVFVLRGTIRDTEGICLSRGDFVSGLRDGLLSADDGSATLFLYCEPSAIRGRSRRVPASARIWRAARASLMDAATLSDEGHCLRLVRWRPGAIIPAHEHQGGEEILVLEGALHNGQSRLPAGSWLRVPPGSVPVLFATTPTLTLLRNGHLRSAGHARAA
jgi:hypothetical protein